MWEFLEANWTWLLLGGFFLLMMRGGGCGMGHQHSENGNDTRDTGGGTTRTGQATKTGGCH